jgi:hypothetical protein
MIQLFGQKRDGRVTRKGVALLLTFWLNLVLLPCAIAVEVPSEGHDCCPPTIKMQQTNCCEVDAASSDQRGGKFEGQDDLVVLTTTLSWPSLPAANISLQEARPPDPAISSPPLHKLFCVYLD